MNLKNVSGYLMCMEMEAALSEKEKCCPGIILLGDARLPVLNVSIPDSLTHFVAALLEEDCRRGADHPPGSRCALRCLMENTYTTCSRNSLEILRQIKFVIPVAAAAPRGPVCWALLLEAGLAAATPPDAS